MSEYKILNHVIKAKNGNYCHAFEFTSVYEYQCLIDSLIEQLQDDFDDSLTNDDFISFIESASIYYIENKSLTDEQNYAIEQEIHNFDFREYIKEQNQ